MAQPAWTAVDPASPDMTQLRLLVRRVAVFEQLRDEDVAFLETRIERRSFRAGDVLMEEGGPGDSLLIVADGTIGLYKKRFPFKRRIATRTRDEWMGEMALLSGKPRYATAIADSDGALWRVPRDAFQEVLSRNPGAAALLSESAAFDRERAEEAGFA